MEEYVNKHKVLRHFDISESVLKTYREQGLPYHRISPRVIRYRLSEVEKWLTNREVKDERS